LICDRTGSSTYGATNHCARDRIGTENSAAHGSDAGTNGSTADGAIRCTRATGAQREQRKGQGGYDNYLFHGHFP
jgi:hypothetical protein